MTGKMIHGSWSRAAPTDRLIAKVANRDTGVETRYLASGGGAAAEKETFGDDLVAEFFEVFGGFRLGPPFMRDFFFRKPMPVCSGPDEERPSDVRWRGALSIYEAEELHELILHPTGKCGWILRYSQEVVEAGTFADVIRALPFTLPNFPTGI